MAGGIVGVNLGMNKGATSPPEQYRLGVRAFASSADFLTINVSSPNTPGLRDLQQEEELLQIVAAARDELGTGPEKPALLVKLSPDLDDASVETLVGQLTDGGRVDGWIVSNTTIARPDSLRSPAAKEGGGLSGAPLRQRSTELVSIVYRASGGGRVIGAGGVDSGEAAYEKIKAGASLVQVYTSLIYNGPLHLATIARGLAACLARDGVSQVSDAIGRDHR
jgi:dihydroorotate dehydrogenase